jgi:integrase
MRLGELFDEWKEKRAPRPQCALEYRRSVDDFVDYIGDIPVGEITDDDILTFRDAVATMPRHLSRADWALTLSERLAKHQGSPEPKVSASTIKKRVGGVQAMLSFAQRNRWISRNVGAGLAIGDDLPRGRVPRRTFLTNELAGLFSAPLFTNPSTWRIKKEGLSDSTIFWLFLIGVTSGARLEEIGQPALADVRRDGQTLYIDIDDYVAEPGGQQKQVKNKDSRRVIPLHKAVIDAGVLQYTEALKRAGHRELFPDLTINTVGKRTQAASQRANRIIDRFVSNDPRLVFHSFRHTFKQRGTTARIPERILDQLCGHSPTTVGQKYGAGQPLWVLSEELHRIDFDCIDAARIAAALRHFDWDAAVAKLPDPPGPGK